MPFPGDDLESFCFFGFCLFLSLTDCAGVNSVGYLLTRFIPSLSSLGQRYFGIDAQSKQLLFSFKAILESLQFTS
jgi:hypothetical protein